MAFSLRPAGSQPCLSSNLPEQAQGGDLGKLGGALWEVQGHAPQIALIIAEYDSPGLRVDRCTGCSLPLSCPTRLPRGSQVRRLVNCYPWLAGWLAGVGRYEYAGEAEVDRGGGCHLGHLPYDATWLFFYKQRDLTFTHFQEPQGNLIGNPQVSRKLTGWFPGNNNLVSFRTSVKIVGW